MISIDVEVKNKQGDLKEFLVWMRDNDVVYRKTDINEYLFVIDGENCTIENVLKKYENKY